jgi:hypothetical protein
MTTATAALAAATITVAHAPFLPGVGLVNGWNVWLLWPVAASFWMLVLLVIAQRFVRRRDESVWLAVALLAALVPSSLAATVERSYADSDRETRSDLVGQIGDRIESTLPKGAYRLVLGGIGLLVSRDPHRVGPGLVAELEREGYRLFVVSRNPVIRTAFPSVRRYDDQRVLGTLYLTAGHRPLDVYPPPRVLVRTGLLGSAGRRELARIEKRLRTAIDDGGGLRLTPVGKRRWRDAARYTPALTIARYLDVDTRLLDGSLSDLYRNGSVDRPKLDMRLLNRHAALVRDDFRLQVSYVAGDARTSR